MAEPKKRLPAIAIATAVVIGLSAVIGAVASRAVVNRIFQNQDVSIDGRLLKASEDINKTCPRTINSETRLDSTVAAPGKAFYYRYTLINLTKADVNLVTIASEVRPEMVNQYRTDPGMKTFRDAGVTLHYQYSDKDGHFITDVVIGPADLK